MIKIEKKFFPNILSENDLTYFAHLEGKINSVDEFSNILITKKPEGYDFRIAPSHPKYNEIIIEELINFHNIFNIRLIFSKSIKTTGTIAFKINL